MAYKIYCTPIEGHKWMTTRYNRISARLAMWKIQLFGLTLNFCDGSYEHLPARQIKNILLTKAK